MAVTGFLLLLIGLAFYGALPVDISLLLVGFILAYTGRDIVTGQSFRASGGRGGWAVNEEAAREEEEETKRETGEAD